MSAIHQVITALCFHCLDLVSGLIGAIKTKSLDSSKMRDGLFKKLGFLLCYSVAYLIDTEGSAIGLKLSISVLPVIITYAVTTEIVSILENISRINPDLLPDQLMKIFKVEKIEGGKGNAEHPESPELGDTDSE